MRKRIGTAVLTVSAMLAIAGGDERSAAASREMAASSSQGSQAEVSATRHPHRHMRYAYRPYYPYRYGHPYYYSPGPFFPYLPFVPDWEASSLW